MTIPVGSFTSAAGSAHPVIISRRRRRRRPADSRPAACRIIRDGDADGATGERVHISPALRNESIRLRVAQVDRIRGEGALVRRNHPGARLHGPARLRHIRRDHDSAGARALRDPIVRLIHAGADDHALDQRIAWHGDGGVGHDVDFERGAFERMALGNAVNLLLYRAGVGVDVDRDWLHATELSRAVEVTPARLSGAAAMAVIGIRCGWQRIEPCSQMA